MVVVVCIGLTASGSAILLLQYESCSCRHLHIGMLVAGDLQGFVVTKRKLIAHEIAFSSFMFPNYGMHMSFAAREHKLFMVFAPPCSDKVVAA